MKTRKKLSQKLLGHVPNGNWNSDDTQVKLNSNAPDDSNPDIGVRPAVRIMEYVMPGATPRAFFRFQQEMLESEKFSSHLQAEVREKVGVSK